MNKNKNLLGDKLIDIDLWEKAAWRATAILSDRKSAPMLGLVFMDRKSAIDIFSDLVNKLGIIDKYDELRISIIEGGMSQDDYGYTVHINSSAENMLKKCESNNIKVEETLITNSGRFSRMNPGRDSKTLELFKDEYHKYNKYLIIPVYADKDMKLEPLFDYMIEKKEIFFRDAKEIKEDDIDYAVLKIDK